MKALIYLSKIVLTYIFTISLSLNSAFVNTNDTEIYFNGILNMIPEEHLEILEDAGWDIVLTNQNLALTYVYNVPIAGITDYSIKTIYIYNTRHSIYRAVIHEVGHVLAYELGNIDETDEFIRIYNDEKNNFTDFTKPWSTHCIVNEDEYFASVYHDMILDYDRTLEDVPLSVEYIEEYLGF